MHAADAQPTLEGLNNRVNTLSEELGGQYGRLKQWERQDPADFVKLDNLKEAVEQIFKDLMSADGGVNGRVTALELKVGNKSLSEIFVNKTQLDKQIQETKDSIKALQDAGYVTKEALEEQLKKEIAKVDEAIALHAKSTDLDDYLTKAGLSTELSQQKNLAPIMTYLCGTEAQKALFVAIQGFKKYHTTKGLGGARKLKEEESASSVGPTKPKRRSTRRKKKEDEAITDETVVQKGSENTQDKNTE